jgi:cell wall-associated NlpC family hydrolase
MQGKSMETKEQRNEFLNAVLSRVGYPYRWGASGPDSFDCCGLVEWGMAKIGRPLGDVCSADLITIFKTRVKESEAKPGSLWLYSNNGHINKITHVMIMARAWGGGGTLIGARGGGHTTVDEKAAWDARAFVDCVLTDYWHPNLVAIVDPFIKEGQNGPTGTRSYNY